MPLTVQVSTQENITRQKMESFLKTEKKILDFPNGYKKYYEAHYWDFE